MSLSKYKVTITETLSREVETEADSRIEAEDKVHDEWADGKYVLDADDFREVEFEASESLPEKMKVVLLEPDKMARVAEIGTDLEDLQDVVGGLIEAGYYFNDDACIICNEEGKIDGLPLNRGIYDDERNLIDIVAGTAFICGCGGENFGSLTEAQQKKYLDEFNYPEKFYKRDGEIFGVRFKPKDIEHEL